MVCFTSAKFSLNLGKSLNFCISTTECPKKVIYNIINILYNKYMLYNPLLYDECSTKCEFDPSTRNTIKLYTVQYEYQFTCGCYKIVANYV